MGVWSKGIIICLFRSWRRLVFFFLLRVLRVDLRWCRIKVLFFGRCRRGLLLLLGRWVLVRRGFWLAFCWCIDFRLLLLFLVAFWFDRLWLWFYRICLRWTSWGRLLRRRRARWWGGVCFSLIWFVWRILFCSLETCVGICVWIVAIGWRVWRRSWVVFVVFWVLILFSFLRTPVRFFLGFIPFRRGVGFWACELIIIGVGRW